MEVRRVSRKKDGGFEVSFGEDGCCYFSRGFLDAKGVGLNLDIFYHHLCDAIALCNFSLPQAKIVAKKINIELKKAETLPEKTIFDWIVLAPDSKGGHPTDSIKLFNVRIAEHNGEKRLIGLEVQEKKFEPCSFDLARIKMENMGPAKNIGQLKI